MAKKKKQQKIDKSDTRRRTKAGRLAKKRGPKPKKGVVPHAPRPKVTKADLAQVTLKLVRGTPSLYSPEVEEEIEEALARVNEKEVIEILEYGIEGKRIHLTIHATSNLKLARGMASLNTGLGMRLNRIWDRVGKGSVFDQRYMMTVDKDGAVNGSSS